MVIPRPSDSSLFFLCSLPLFAFVFPFVFSREQQQRQRQLQLLATVCQAMPSQHKVCVHGIQLRKCRRCKGGGSYLCVHGVQKHRCKKCPKTGSVGTSLCKCGKVRHQCSKCRRNAKVKKVRKCGKRLTRSPRCEGGGGSLCAKHGRRSVDVSNGVPPQRPRTRTSSGG